MKYSFQQPLDTGSTSSGTSVSSNLYSIDLKSDLTSAGFENPYNKFPSIGCMDTFNYTPCIGAESDINFFNGVPSFGNNLELNALNSAFASPSFNFDFGNIMNMYNSYMQNILNNYKQNLNVTGNTTELQTGEYTPAERVENKKNNDDYIKELHPLMQQKVRQLEAYAKSKGYTFRICSGYRTREQQIALQEKYKDEKGRVAGADSSPHRFGRAIDISSNGINGILSEEQSRDLGNYAKSIGLRWGGDFKSYRERWHFDLPASATA